jgi:ribonuclease BN (tRNA processing enzyme)
VKLTILGPHGGELPGCRSTCFLVDDSLALDAGALTSTLTLSQLARIDHVLLTHSHFDHVKDLPMLSDVLVGRRDSPVVIYSNEACIDTLEKHLFNDVLWPDFTRIPSQKNPVFKLKRFKAGASLRVGPYRVKSVLVTHPVESCGFVIADAQGSTLAMSGDTGPTNAFWKLLNKTDNISVLLLECSFPNSLQALADVSGHLTPHTLEQELQKFDCRGCKILLYHLKPAYIPQIANEVKHLNVRVAQLDEEFDF